MSGSSGRPNGARFGVLAFAICAALLPSTAAAQASLGGAFVEYFAVGAEGAPYDGSQSMRWRTTAVTAATCDLYSPGTPASSFTVAMSHSGGVSVATNGAGSAGVGTEEITTTTPTAASGRTITWAGALDDGAAGLAVRVAYLVPSAEHHVIATVELENTGTEPLTDVYFLFNGDPDQGFCMPAADRDNANDVARQPPADRSALATSSIGARAMRPAATVALGAFDGRARASTAGFFNEDPATTHASPGDEDGANVDVSHTLVFRHPALAVGAQTTMRFAWVWAGDVSTVSARFDALECALSGEGGVCAGVGGAPGTCRAGVCCTGCWDGSACQAGLTPAVCGDAGGACADCDDGQSCTDDVCTTGTCDSAPLPGFCFASGQCVLDGADNPDNECEVCAPLANPLGFSAKASGEPCDDGQFCTEGDACDGASACASSPRVCPESDACDSQACDESADQCVGSRADGCAIDGACIAAGTADPLSACRVCDPAQASDAYHRRPIGSRCGESSCAAGVLMPGASCDDVGECVVPPDFVCPGAGLCASDAMSCADGCLLDAHCPEAQHCDGQECLADLPTGGGCSRGAECAGMRCVDGVCCDAICDGPCESCALVDSVGTCTPAAIGADPRDMCGGLGCDGSGACVPGDAGVAADGGVRADAGAADAGSEADASPEADASAAIDGGDADGVALSGGGLCAARPGSTDMSWALFGLVFAALGLRRRRAFRG